MISHQKGVYMLRSEQINDLLAALVTAKKTMEAPKRIKKAYGYLYAPLEEVLRAVEPSLLANGLFITHDRNLETNEVITFIYHTSGQYISTKIKIEYKAENKMNFMQSLGSASTYGMRYNILALLNLCGEDDDDGATSGDKTVQKESKSTTAAVTKEYQKQLVERISQAGCIKEVKDVIKTLPHQWTASDVEVIENILAQKASHA